MKRSPSQRLIVPVILGLVVAGVLMASLLIDGDDGSNEAEDNGGEATSIWRCHACARISTQSWQTCRTVTGRGSEEAARELVSQRVCEEAADPQAQCSIFSIDCRELPASPVKASPRD